MTRSMTITAVGHESWLVSADGTSVAIDPLLRDVFGHGYPISYPLAPARELRLDRLPPLAAVIVTSDHIDHLDLPSLHLLDRRIPIFVGPLHPVVSRVAIEYLGFLVQALEFGQPSRVGALNLCLYRPRATALGQSRDAQVLAWPEREPGAAIYLAGSSPMSSEYLEAAAARDRPRPRLVLASQSRSDGVASELATLPPFSGGDGTERVLREVCDAAAALRASRVIVGGAGFAMPAVGWRRDLGATRVRTSPPRAIDRRRIAAAPGDVFAAAAPARKPARAAWIKRTPPPPEPAAPAAAAHPAPLTPPTDADRKLREAFDRVVSFLPALAREIALYPLGGPGEPALSAGTSDGLGAKSLLLTLLGGPSGTHQYALDVTRTTFVPTREALDTMVRDFPLGLVCYVLDIDAVLEGQICIWDLASDALQAWNHHGATDTLVLRFCQLFSTRIRPALAQRYLIAAAHLLFDDWGSDYLESRWPRHVRYLPTEGAI